ncbi:hypothetical protein E2562_015638, partial [Oryza meyeriana var. granulata]
VSELKLEAVTAESLLLVTAAPGQEDLAAATIGLEEENGTMSSVRRPASSCTAADARVEAAPRRRNPSRLLAETGARRGGGHGGVTDDGVERSSAVGDL